MTEFERYILMDVLWVVGSAFLLILVLVKLRARRRRAKQDALAEAMQIQTRADIERRDRAAKSHLDHVFGRKVMYKREMAQRELDRYYGKLPADTPDPTYQEWAEAKGLSVAEENEVPEEVSAE